jgi:hypothetical protein
VPVFRNARAIANKFAELSVTADEKLRIMAEAIVIGAAVPAIKAAYGDEMRLAPLQPDTIVQKERLGAADPYAPLVLTGELRESEYGVVEPVGVGNFAGAAGTDDPRGEWHEKGVPKHNLPSRPVHWIGANDILPLIAKAVPLFGSSIATGDIPVSGLKRIRVRRL